MIRIKNKKINLLRNGKTILQKNLIKAIKGYMIIKNMLIIKDLIKKYTKNMLIIKDLAKALDRKQN